MVHPLTPSREPSLGCHTIFFKTNVWKTNVWLEIAIHASPSIELVPVCIAMPWIHLLPDSCILRADRHMAETAHEGVIVSFGNRGMVVRLFGGMPERWL